MLRKLLSIKPVYAHCDLPCGVYDPAQARIEAESVQSIQNKYSGMSETDKVRALIIKEERAELVKHHLMVLWADYFKPEHAKEYPQLHESVWKALKQASECKRSVDPASGETLVSMVNDIADIFWETKKAH